MLTKALTSEEVKTIAEKTLLNMGCTELLFSDPKKDLIVVIFNCKNLTSFKADLPGWLYSGIHLDPTNTRQYKIDFKKIAS